MQAIGVAVVSAVGGVLVKMLLGLASEKFIKQAIIMGLERLVKLTETKEDDELLLAAKQIWEAAEPAAK